MFFGVLINSDMFISPPKWWPAIYLQPFPFLHDTLSETTTLFTSVVNMSVTCFCMRKCLNVTSIWQNLKLLIFIYEFLNSSYEKDFLSGHNQRAETIIWYSPSFMNTLLVILDFPLLIVVVKAWTYLFFRHKILVFLCMSKYLYPYFCSTCRKSANAHPILQYAFPCTILQHQNLCVKELYPDFVLCATSPCK